MQLPSFGGNVRKKIAQQCGYRASDASLFEKGANSGLWLGVADSYAALTVPGAGDA